MELGRKRKNEVESDIGEKFIDFLYGQWGAKCHCSKEAASDGEEKYGKNKVVCADGGFHGCFLSEEHGLLGKGLYLSFEMVICFGALPRVNIQPVLFVH